MGILQVMGLKQADAGVFRCVATNIANTRYSQEATLNVTGGWHIFGIVCGQAKHSASAVMTNVDADSEKHFHLSFSTLLSWNNVTHFAFAV